MAEHSDFTTIFGDTLSQIVGTGTSSIQLPPPPPLLSGNVDVWVPQYSQSLRSRRAEFDSARRFSMSIVIIVLAMEELK